MAHPIVLIVEDDPAVRQVLARVVQRVAAHVAVVPVASVADARQTLATHVVTAVILDYQLPDGTALDVLAALPAPRPVLALSADATVAGRVLAAGAIQFLPKPIELSVMQTAIHALLAQAAGGPGALSSGP